MAQFDIRNLTFSYAGTHGRPCLENISVRIEAGEFVVLCGCSGSGKSTLLRHLKTVLRPRGKSDGSVLFHEMPLCDVSEREQAAKIGFVMQNPDDQIVTDKVWHELAFGPESMGCDPTVMRTRVAEMACYFGIQDRFHRDVATLSGGQKQLLNLASVMVMQPEVLILDEPTAQLDPIAASDFLNTVRKINAELGTTVIITEHRLEDIFPHADRAIVLDGGRVIADDLPARVGQRLFERSDPMFSAMPTPIRVFYGAGGTGEASLTVRQGRSWLSRAIAQPTETCASAAPRRSEAHAEPVLRLKDLWFRYERDGADILRGVSAEVPAGKLYAILGGNGAGKSTALKVMAGIRKPYRGKVLLFGRPQEKYRADELYHGCLAMLPQDPKSLFVKSTVREELEEMSGETEECARAAKLCRIAELLERHPYDLSGGEQQRVALAKVLLTRPRLLLLDEPTKGIDSSFKKTFAELLDDLKSQGITIVMVSHDVEFCAEHADLVSMFFDGRILTTDTPRRFFGNNCFYTTAAHRMSRHVFDTAITAEDVVELYRRNTEGGT